jgi:hypothetical protein
MSKNNYNATKLEDKFQIEAFQTHFKIFMLDPKTPTFEALALAIACTSDDAVIKILKKNPNAIQQWAEFRKQEKLRNYTKNKLAKEKARDNKRRLLNESSESDQETVNEECHDTIRN